MEVGKLVIIIVLALLIAIGVACIYNAREITKKFFSTTNQNQVVTALKILGSFLSIGSAICIMLIER